MEILKTTTRINFLAYRKLALSISALLVVGSLVSIVGRGLHLGIDFTGGTLVEVGYQQAVVIDEVRDTLTQQGINNAVVQHFGTLNEVLVRLPSDAVAGLIPPVSRDDGGVQELLPVIEDTGDTDTTATDTTDTTDTDTAATDTKVEAVDTVDSTPTASNDDATTEPPSAAAISEVVMAALRVPYDERVVEAGGSTNQQCLHASEVSDCQVQMRRVEFVGPQIGGELANQGGLAMLYALIGILIYVAFRFEWRFAIGSVLALLHDVILTIGVFSLLQIEFSLPVLAAVLAVIGYSLNDTIVVYDRIRENFRKLRKYHVLDIMNTAINQTLPRTLLTSLTTLLVVGTLLIFGGEIIRGFSFALLIGVIVGTYSSIFIASPAVLALGIRREDLLVVAKEGDDAASGHRRL